ncbi:hypothetical protein UFOVP861_22 [uncultured Caudovirales phage]|uniref:Uncharacterized protein n=1 Tax=uncultured Caudovirales phage TaxID=2100421 RepID=A0A6J5PDA4_9CAUD|nr:hypothetical protein UFOVP861_22 [uncultured Caudovirales phage]
MQISTSAQSLIDTVKTCKGQFVRVEYKTTVKLAAAHKNVQVIKHVEGIFRTGIDYAHKASVQAAIASGERGEVQSLPWGEWAVFPWIIAHKGAEYVRLYPVQSQHCTTRYEILKDGVPQSAILGTSIKEQVSEYLTPAEKEKLLNPDSDRAPLECITKKIEDVKIIGCWHNETSQEIIDAEQGEW